MQEEAIEGWKELEERSKTQILVKTGMLWLGDDQSQNLKNVITGGGGEELTNKQFKERFPALVAMPDNLKGYFTPEAGIVRVQESLQVSKKLSLEQGAEFRFNAIVTQVDTKQGFVVLENGEKIYAKEIVVSCGSVTDAFYEKGTYKMTRLPLQTYVVNDKTGLPPIMIVWSLPRLHGQELSGLLDGDQL